MAAGGGRMVGWTVVVGLLLLLLAVAMGSADAVTAGVNCGAINVALLPCFGYLTNKSPTPAAPSASCCASVLSLNSQFSSGPPRQGACECLKQNAQSIPGLVAARVSDLSVKCNVHLGLSVSQSTDCTKACLPKPKC